MEVKEFMKDPLVKWLAKCLDNELDDDDSKSNKRLRNLLDRRSLWKLVLEINADCLTTAVEDEEGSLEAIVQEMARFYDSLGMLLLRLPSVAKLADEDESDANCVQEARYLLLLLLNAAVICPNKARFISVIKGMSEDAQLAIMTYIKETTEGGKMMILTPENARFLNRDVVYEKFQALAQERDVYMEMWARSRRKNCEEEEGEDDDDSEKEKLRKRARKLEKEVQEYLEKLDDSTGRLENLQQLVDRLKCENQRLEARRAKWYRDEGDVVREQAERTKSLEAEVESYREKMQCLEYYETRVKELESSNDALEETRNSLEDEVDSLRSKWSRVKELESEVCRYKSEVSELTRGLNESAEKCAELYAENSRLHSTICSRGNESSRQEPEESSNATNASLSEQINTSDLSRVLKLELENRRLRASTESRIDLLEGEKKRLEAELEKMLRLDESSTDSGQLAVLKSCYQVLLQEQDHASKENAKLRSKAQRYEMLKEEHDSLRIDLFKLLKESEKWRDMYCWSQAQVEKLQAEPPSKPSEEQQQLLKEKFETLLKVNNSLRQDRLSLMKHVSQILEQNKHLYNQCKQVSEDFHESELQLIDKINQVNHKNHQLTQKLLQVCSNKSSNSSEQKKLLKGANRVYKKVRNVIFGKKPKKDPAPQDDFDESLTNVVDSEEPVEDFAQARKRSASLNHEMFAKANAGPRRMSLGFVNRSSGQNLSSIPEIEPEKEGWQEIAWV